MGDVMKARKPILAAVIILTMANVAPADGDKMAAGTANRACEISFSSRKAYADPFNDVTLDAVVTAADGSTQVVPAFWAGGQTWRIRYSAPQPGDYRYQTRCFDAANANLHGASGIIRVAKYEAILQPPGVEWSQQHIGRGET